MRCLDSRGSCCQIAFEALTRSGAMMRHVRMTPFAVECFWTRAFSLQSKSRFAMRENGWSASVAT